jgi:hypothetical protein
LRIILPSAEVLTYLTFSLEFMILGTLELLFVNLGDAKLFVFTPPVLASSLDVRLGFAKAFNSLF